jgi:hypothetical protein
VQAQVAEQQLLACAEAMVGQVERGSDRQVLGVHQLQPVITRRCQVGGQVRGGPAGWW